MTGYGRGQSGTNGTQFCVEVHSVNRKQSDISVTLPRELAELEPRLREQIHQRISRGRLNAVVTFQTGAAGAQKAAIDTELARVFYNAMSDLQAELGAAGEVSIDTVLRAPGVLCVPEEQLTPETALPPLQAALGTALDELIIMREREGRNLAKDLIHRLKAVREWLHAIAALRPAVIEKYRQTLAERVQKAGVDLPVDDERILKEIVFFADRSDISEEITRLESHFAEFAHHLRKNEPVGRTLDFMTQEISREFNTLGAKANDAGISQLVVLCKAEMEKIREQIQNIE